jgi:hypothetical protein
LVVGTRKTASLGRVAFWIVFGLCIWFWVAGREVSPTMGETLWAVLAYNLGGKAVNNFSRHDRQKGRDHDDDKGRISE